MSLDMTCRSGMIRISSPFFGGGSCAKTQAGQNPFGIT